MGTENREARIYFVGSRPQASFYGDTGEASILDHWLTEFDAKQAALNERQDAFFEKLGIEVIDETEEPKEHQFEDSSDTRQ